MYGVSGSPAIVVDERGTIVTIETPDNFQLEWIARGVTIRMGGHAQLIDYPMSGAQYKRTAIYGTVSMGIAIGEAVMNAHAKSIHPIEAACAATQDTIYGRGVILFSGATVLHFAPLSTFSWSQRGYRAPPQGRGGRQGRSVGTESLERY